MGTARGGGLAAAAISIALHLAAAGAFLRPLEAGPAPAPSIEVWLAPAPQAAPVSLRPARVVEDAAARGRATAVAARAPAVAPPAGAAAAPPRPPQAFPDAPAPPAAPTAPREVAQSPPRADGFDAYAQLVWARVDRARPRSGARSVAAEVAFDLDRAGRLTRLRLVSTSGIPDFDRAAMRAVRAAAPYPRPPDDIDPSRLQFRVLIRSPSA